MGKLKKFVVGTMVAGAIASFFYKDKIVGAFNTVNNKVYSIITTDPNEAAENLKEAIIKNCEIIRDGGYDLGQFASDINSYRSIRDVNEDAVQQIKSNVEPEFRRTIDGLVKTNNSERNLYTAQKSVNSQETDSPEYQKVIDGVVSKNDAERNEYTAQKSFDALGAEKQYKFVEQEATDLPEERLVELTLKTSDRFSKEVFEALVPELYHKSGKKFGNKYRIFVNLFSDKKQQLRDLIDKGSQLYEKGKEKGKALMDQYIKQPDKAT